MGEQLERARKRKTREAVALYRQLAERNRDEFEPGLARSLTNLGTMLRELGQREAALEATREAVAIRRRAELN